jgi:hypothetical protein
MVAAKAFALMVLATLMGPALGVMVFILVNGF